MPTVLVKDGDNPSEVAAALLRAARPDTWRVRKVTAGRRPAFEVPDDVYEAFAAEHGLDVEDGGANGDTPTPPLVSGEPVIETGDELPHEPPADGEVGEGRVDDPAGEPDWSALGEAPDRNDRTDDWREFLRPVLGDDVDTLNRTALIEAYDGRDA
ncbi:hypothetical protein SEA_BADDON_22 [Gordonia phage Baddon]|nr:hypothetical protein SEA_BADDON_22 [Gordonia phage Baddon]